MDWTKRLLQLQRSTAQRRRGQWMDDGRRAGGQRTKSCLGWAINLAAAKRWPRAVSGAQSLAAT